MMRFNKELQGCVKDWGYHLDKFQEYVKYHNAYEKETHQSIPTIEGYACELGLHPDKEEVQQWFGDWVGNDGDEYLPDYVSFQKYCLHRNLNPYEEGIVIEFPKKEDPKRYTRTFYKAS